jgi:hypothetical protein
LIMPDFRATLEARLRQEASTSVTPADPRHALAGRRKLAAVVAVALAVAIVAVAASDRHGAPAAYGRPLITLSPPARHIPTATRRQLAGLLNVAFGARLRHAWAIHALGGTAYLAQGDIGWCLQEPSHGPSNEPGGGACTVNADFAQAGISVFSEHQFIAAIPQGVRPPTITTPDGNNTTTRPDQGVVAANHLHTGTTITTYNRDRSPHTQRLPTPSPAQTP